MSTLYPDDIDSFSNPTAGDRLTTPPHAQQHADANDAIEAIETELGINPSGVDTDVATRLARIDQSDPAAGTAGLRSLGGSSTQAAAGNHNHTIASLSDADITGLADGDILRYNGSEWVNINLGVGLLHAQVHSDSDHSGPNKVRVSHTPSVGSATVYVAGDRKQLGLVSPGLYAKVDSTNDKLDIVNPGYLNAVKPGVGMYIPSAGTGSTQVNGIDDTGPVNNNTVIYIPVFVPSVGSTQTVTANSLNVILTANYTTGSVKLALYNSDQYGWPQTKLAPSSSDSITIATGSIARALTQALSPTLAITPGKYWIGILGSNITGSGSFRCHNGPMPGIPYFGTSALSTVGFSGVYETGNTFLPTTANITGNVRNAPFVTIGIV